LVTGRLETGVRLAPGNRRARLGQRCIEHLDPKQQQARVQAQITLNGGTLTLD
jgi:hypothetical protein